MSDLDITDRQLLALLRQNARESVSTLAQRLGVSRATARQRLDRLVAAGVIEGFTVKLRSTDGARMIRAIMLLKIDGALSEQVVRELNRIPEILELYSTSGQWDSIAILEADTLQHFDAVLRQVGQVRGVRVTETSLMLTSRKQPWPDRVRTC